MIVGRMNKSQWWVRYLQIRSLELGLDKMYEREGSASTFNKILEYMPSWMVIIFIGYKNNVKDLYASF